MTEERKFNKVNAVKVKTDDIMGIMYYVKVTENFGGNTIDTKDLDRDMSPISVRGRELIEGCLSADQYAEEVDATKTKVAELLVTSYNRPFSVCFKKQDGETRVIRARLVQPEPLLGRSMVEDLDITDGNNLRQVDHRTIEWLVVDGVKYKVKAKASTYTTIPVTPTKIIAKKEVPAKKKTSTKKKP